MKEDDLDKCVRTIDKHLGNDVDQMIDELPGPVKSQLTSNLMMLKSFAMSVIMQLFLREKIILKDKTNGKKR